MFYYVYRIICFHPESICKYYYGYRSSKIDPILDNYWSSSSYLKEAIAIYGKQWFKKKIIKVYYNKKDALSMEIKFHEKFQVHTNPLFFNKCKQTKLGFYCFGDTIRGKTYEEIHGEEKANLLRKQRSEKAKGKNNKGVNNPMYGKNHTKEVKKYQSSLKQGEKHPQYGWSWITNGVENNKVNLKKDKIPQGWKLGRTTNIKPPSTQGKKWYNNGVEESLLFLPPDGWARGRLRKS